MAANENRKNSFDVDELFSLMAESNSAFIYTGMTYEETMDLFNTHKRDKTLSDIVMNETYYASREAFEKGEITKEEFQDDVQLVTISTICQDYHTDAARDNLIDAAKVITDDAECRVAEVRFKNVSKFFSKNALKATQDNLQEFEDALVQVTSLKAIDMNQAEKALIRLSACPLPSALYQNRDEMVQRCEDLLDKQNKSPVHARIKTELNNN